MPGIEDRLLKNASIIMFLSDILTQPAPVNRPSIELSEEGRYGLGLLLRDLGLEAKRIYDDAGELLIKGRRDA